ncbi:MAG: hypothetical protein LBT82_00380 [Oscillospiraceae bacterium]|jgi:aspartate/tyrosine/aromatic aminotransferase|nr:hypothetical protein [Oscillospiraceae bacterium]
MIDYINPTMTSSVNCEDYFIFLRCSLKLEEKLNLMSSCLFTLVDVGNNSYDSKLELPNVNHMGNKSNTQEILKDLFKNNRKMAYEPKFFTVSTWGGSGAYHQKKVTINKEIDLTDFSLGAARLKYNLKSFVCEDSPGSDKCYTYVKTNDGKWLKFDGSSNKPQSVSSAVALEAAEKNLMYYMYEKAQ